jgi:hypothetical protein
MLVCKKFPSFHTDENEGKKLPDTRSSAWEIKMKMAGFK